MTVNNFIDDLISYILYTVIPFSLYTNKLTYLMSMCLNTFKVVS